MDILKKRKTVMPLATMIAVAATAAPTAAQAKQANGERGADAKPKYEREYIDARREVISSFDVRTAGRNIVRDGFREKDGDVREAKRDEVVTSTERLRAWAETPEPSAAEPAETEAAPTEAPAEQTGGSYDTSGAPTSVVECESGGDYGAVNPAGYYGAYQFDQGTWDSYAPGGYQGTNPASAPPEVQDAAAAAVPYDAWPNC